MGYLSDWLQELGAHAAEDAKHAEAERAAEAERLRQRQMRRDARAAQRLRGAQRRIAIERRRFEAERYRTDTLANQLQRWWAAQHVATRMRPYTFSEISAQLRGVVPGNSPGNIELFAALRAAGWRKVRVWIDSPDHDRRQWLPPGVVNESDAMPSKRPAPVKRPRGRPRKFDHVSLAHPEDYM